MLGRVVSRTSAVDSGHEGVRVCAFVHWPPNSTKRMRRNANSMRKSRRHARKSRSRLAFFCLFWFLDKRAANYVLRLFHRQERERGRGVIDAGVVVTGMPSRLLPWLVWALWLLHNVAGNARWGCGCTVLLIDPARLRVRCRSSHRDTGYPCSGHWAQGRAL